MAEPPITTRRVPQSIPVGSPLPPPTISEHQPRTLFSFPKRPSIRVTSEFDSENALFFQRLSCKLFDGFAKLQLSFQNNRKGEIADSQLTFSSKHLSVFYDLEEKNALIRSSFDVGPRLRFSSTHDVKVRASTTSLLRLSRPPTNGHISPGVCSFMSTGTVYMQENADSDSIESRQGEVTMVEDLADPGYTFQLSSPFLSISLPKATLKFPVGEVSLEEREEGEEEVRRRTLAINGVLKGHALNGVCTAVFSNDDLNLKYRYKLKFIPSISLPSNALSFAFKRRFNPSTSLSYWYNFSTNHWNAEYKQTYVKDFKFKAGYDSAVRLGWAALWVGDEGGKAKTTPMKVRVQLMVQVPQDSIYDAVLTFRVKKRWDL